MSQKTTQGDPMTSARTEMQMARIRELARTATNQLEIGKALGFASYQRVSALLNQMPDGPELRARIRENGQRERVEQRARSEQPKPEPFAPSPEEIAEFKRVVAVAQSFSWMTKLDSEVWRARGRRDEILLKWAANKMLSREMARLGGVSVYAVYRWRRELVASGRLERTDHPYAAQLKKMEGE